MISIPLTTKSLVFNGPSSDDDDGQPTSRLKLPTKCYAPQIPVLNQGWTLLFTHCTGSHKEQWEPVIQKLMDKGKVGGASRVQEAWSLDWPSHGEGAILNEEYLKNRTSGVTATEWASTIANFIKIKGFDPRRTIAIGHCAGATAFLLSTTHFPASNPPFAALIIVEPSMIPSEAYAANEKYMEKAMKMINKGVSGRKDIWQSRDAALEWMMNTSPWNRWDPRILNLYRDYGLRDLRADGTVTLRCDKKLEAAAFSESHVGCAFAASARFRSISESLPVHFIFGARIDVIPNFQREAILDTSQGGKVASLQTIAGAGHWVLQEDPDSLAQAVWTVISGLDSDSASPSKL